MKQRENVLRNEQGFTLIEIIAVLVILGLLAVVAVPKYLDLQTDAAEKAAYGIYAAAQSAASLNFAQGLLKPTGHTPITTGTLLLAGLDPAPEGWKKNSGDDGITDADGNYEIKITAGETITGDNPAPAKLNATWDD